MPYNVPMQSTVTITPVKNAQATLVCNYPGCGGEFSGDAGDYFYLPADRVMTCDGGKGEEAHEKTPMALVFGVLMQVETLDGVYIIPTKDCFAEAATVADLHTLAKLLGR